MRGIKSDGELGICRGSRKVRPPWHTMGVTKSCYQTSSVLGILLRTRQGHFDSATEVISHADRMASKEVGHVHQFLAGNLQKKDTNRPGTGRDHQSIRSRLNDGTGRGIRGLVKRLGLVDDHPLGLNIRLIAAIEVGKSNRPRLHRPDMVVHTPRGLRPFDQAVVLVKFRGFGDLRFILTDDLGPTRYKVVDRLGDEWGSQSSEPGFKHSGGFVRVQRGSRKLEHSSGIDLGGHENDGHSRLGLSVLNRASDRSGTTIGGKDRPMEVDSA